MENLRRKKPYIDMNKRSLIISSLFLILLSYSNANNYQATVVKLSPTYYYELNEITTDEGALDTMGNAPKAGSFNGDYGVGGPEVGGEGPLYVFSADDFKYATGPNYI